MVGANYIPQAYAFPVDIILIFIPVNVFFITLVIKDLILVSLSRMEMLGYVVIVLQPKARVWVIEEPGHNVQSKNWPFPT